MNPFRLLPGSPVPQGSNSPTCEFRGGKQQKQCVQQQWQQGRVAGRGVPRQCMGCQLGSHLGNAAWPPQGSSPSARPATVGAQSPLCSTGFPRRGPRQGGCLGFSSQSTGFKGRWRSAWIRTQHSTAESSQPLEMSGFIPEEEEAGRLKKVPISQHRVGCAALPWSRFPPHTPKSGVFAFKEEQRQPQNKIEISQTREGHPPMKRERKHLETLRQRSANRSQGSSFLGSCKY